MQLSEIMTRDITSVGPDSNLVDAARKMAEIDAGVLPVCEGDQVKGIITDRDIAVRAVAKGYDPNSFTVKDVMTADVLYVYDDQDVREAAKLMEDRKVRRLVVLDRNKHLCGIVSLGDLALETRDQKLSGEVLSRVSEPNP